MKDKKKNIAIGILGIQGDIEENIAATIDALRTLKINGDVYPVRYPEEIEQVDGLILPGGESTVISTLITIQGTMFQLIKRHISEGLPVMGACAGMILLARRAYDKSVGETKQQLMGNLEIIVERNAFGRQSDSFETDLEIPIIGKQKFRGIFIRAPVVTEVTGGQTQVIATFNNKIVAVKQNNILCTSFHPELSGDNRLHREFIKTVIEFKRNH
ncbi:MAG TPA: pyridoxal 5'-phosphate synthase glutaminase subunit PdxT [Nitrososphaeraceae archaeon]|nr:pyridoxal 5'-phosphate synthase glutaminase subunit PdxT [Nitrososphaeraceae archaeon]